jgi:uncharacterized membrane protein
VAAVMAPVVMLTGLLDWLRMAPDAPGKKLGMLHAALNYAVVGLTGWHLLNRRGTPQDHKRIDPRVSGAILGLVTVSGHLGGELAYNKGVRAEQAQPLR